MFTLAYLLAGTFAVIGTISIVAAGLAAVVQTVIGRQSRDWVVVR